MNEAPRNCHDCGVSPDKPHEDGCDTAVCTRTGRQRLMCGMRPVMVAGHFADLEQYDPHPGEDCGQDVWTGQWPGEADAIRLGWWCYFVPGGVPSWVTCRPEHSGAVPDLNRLAIDGTWNRDLLRWEG